jgi:peroxin-5
MEKERMRQRSAVMMRHMDPHQAAAAMERMNLEAREMTAQAQMARNAAMMREAQQLGDRWAQGYGGQRHAAQSGKQWVDEFSGAQMGRQSSQQWADEFARHAPPSGMHALPRVDQWANEFHAQRSSQWGEDFGAMNMKQNQWANEYAQQSRDAQAPMDGIAVETAKQSSALAATLNADPKFANSKFAQLMSKLGSGQVVVGQEGLQTTSGTPQMEHIARGDQWAQEFTAALAQRRDAQWANEFAPRQMHPSNASQQWAQEYANGIQAPQGMASNAEDWANEFKTVPNEWAAEFEQMANQEPQWMEKIWDDMQSQERYHYKFTDPNPYLGQHGLEETTMNLARDGVLTEAVLAAEAWVRQDEKNSEAWFHLGRIQAENDDDQQSIAAMRTAREANPRNPNVLLGLVVSHANELDEAEALEHAHDWLGSQERFQSIVNGYSRPSREDIMTMVQAAARQAPRDADVQTVLGVMAHLTRNYDEAINAFQRAAALRPEDYSLWNKIGATMANGTQSADAIGAYRRALDLKANYVRAWANMGIGYANQGRYAESLPYYVRALSMNPNPESPTWGYVRISLGCTGRLDLMPLVDSYNLAALNREFPLQ